MEFSIEELEELEQAELEIPPLTNEQKYRYGGFAIVIPENNDTVYIEEDLTGRSTPLPK